MFLSQRPRQATFRGSSSPLSSVTIDGAFYETTFYYTVFLPKNTVVYGVPAYLVSLNMAFPPTWL